MKKTSLWVFTLLFLATGITSCGQNDPGLLPETPLILTETEIASLRFMREEEKLARDVYAVFDQKYNLNVFHNINSSEQTHMDAVLRIMEKYGIEDISATDPGVFNNPDLQQLYNDLVAQGNLSLTDALVVGATIEDVDIRDLGNATGTTERADILAMFGMLECGSRNHMRAFTKNLDMRGETYTPQYITVEEYNDILAAGHEMCGM